jgi:NAD(P)H-dependent FMN reductase
MPKLQVVITSTREARQGPLVANWFLERAKAHGKFDIEMIDLRDVALPLFDEPMHPRLRQPAHDHTKRWAKIVGDADAFVFITPEYNYGMPPALLNALDYLAHEWAYKAAGFVSYGGTSGGTRSVQMAKLVMSSLKIVPIPEAVSFPFFNKLITPSGTFEPASAQDQAVTTMLDELAKWTAALKTLRT